MSAIVDITRKVFGKLRAVRLHPERKGKARRTQWLCRCKCGAEVLVTTSDLRTGRVKSCGLRCPLRRKRRGRPITSKAIRALYRQTEVQEDEEGIWYAQRKIAEHMGVSEATVRNWFRECQWLDDRGLRKKLFDDGLGRRSTPFGLKSYRNKGPNDINSLDDIQAAQARLTKKPDYPGCTPMEDACQETGYCEQYLRRKLRRANKKAKRERGKRFSPDQNGALRPEPCIRSYVPDDFLAELKQQRQSQETEGKITVKGTVELLGAIDPTITIGEIHHLIVDGFLDAEDGEIMTEVKGGDGLCLRLQPCKLLDRKSVSALKTALTKLPEEIIEAARGRPGRSPGRLRLAAEWLKTNPPELAEPANGAASQTVNAEPMPVPNGAARSTPATPLVLSPLQREIMAALNGKAMKKDDLEAKLHVDSRRLYYGGTPDGKGGLNELLEHGRVRAGRGRYSSGYYRPDSPPSR